MLQHARRSGEVGGFCFVDAWSGPCMRRGRFYGSGNSRKGSKKEKDRQLTVFLMCERKTNCFNDFIVLFGVIFWSPRGTSGYFLGNFCSGWFAGPPQDHCWFHSSNSDIIFAIMLPPFLKHFCFVSSRWFGTFSSGILW